MHFPGLSHSGSGTRVLHKGADSVGPAFCALPRSSSSGDQVLGERGHPQLKAATYRLPRPCCLVFWVYNERIFSGVPCVSWGADFWLQPSQRMLTVQNPKKSWLATKPPCNLVDDASLGPRLPPSGSGCPPLPVSSGGWASPQPASSAQSFVL